MKVRLIEWRRHELGDIELDKLPFERFEYQGLVFTVQAHEVGDGITLELKRVESIPWSVEKIVLPSTSTEEDMRAFLKARGYHPLPEVGDESDGDEVDYSGCAAAGVGGMHSEEFGDVDGQCRWCGARNTNAEIG